MSEFSEFLLQAGFHEDWSPAPSKASYRFESYSRPFRAEDEAQSEVKLPAGGRLEVTATTQMGYEPHSCKVALCFKLPNGLPARTVMELVDPQRLPEQLEPAIKCLRVGAISMVRAVSFLMLRGGGEA
jgi:hypothetical protein